MKSDFIINNDPTLKYFIVDAEINYFNDFQVNLRFAALRIALFKYINNINYNDKY